MPSSGPIPGTFFKKQNQYDGPIANLNDTSGGTVSDNVTGANVNSIASLTAKVNTILEVLREKGLIRR